METEDQICRRYEAAFAAIAALDRRYYQASSASLQDRRQYAERQAKIEELRSRFYAELAMCRERRVHPFRRCRSFTRRSRRSRINPA